MKNVRIVWPKLLRNLLKINLLSSLLATIFIILTEPITFSIVLPLMWVQCTFSILITIYVAIRETFKKTEYSTTFLLSFIIILIGGVQSILVTQHILPPPELLPITCTIFVFIQSSILSKKFSIAYRTAERLSENLFDEVTAQTKNAVDQKNRALASEKEVSNLLNNMISSPLDQGNENFLPSSIQIATIDINNCAQNVIPELAKATVNIRFNDLHTSKSLTDWMSNQVNKVFYNLHTYANLEHGKKY